MKKVLVFGTFDIVHMGHIRMFKEAKEYGDYLAVCVSRDINAEIAKGERPYNSEDDRAEYLRHITLVDEVLMGHLSDMYRNIGIVKPDIIALGYDQRLYVDNLANAITAMGLNVQIVRLQPYTQDKYRSSILKKYIQKIL